MTDLMNLSGPRFLEVFTALSIGALALGFALRWLLRAPGGSPHPLPADLDPFEVAMLLGPKAVVHTALAKLLHEKAVTTEGGLLVTTGARRRFGTQVEQLVHDAINEQEDSNDKLIERAQPAIARLKLRARKRGWLVGETQGLWAQLLSPLPMLCVLLLGIGKILVGLERDKPILILCVLCIGGAVGLVFLLRPVLISRLGASVYRALREDQMPLYHSSRGAESPQALSSHALCLAVAIYGLDVITVGDFALLPHHLLASSLSTSSTSTSSSSGGCGGDSSGGSSCGGGCGGCGGGD
ncbi:TIGR04222 domain-containing membrane protein [Myxococcus sp. 1LA]